MQQLPEPLAGVSCHYSHLVGRVPKSLQCQRIMHTQPLCLPELAD